MGRVFNRFALVMVCVCALAVAFAAHAAEAKGKIKSIAAEKNEFVMADIGGQEWTMTCTPECKILLNGKQAKITNLKPDDEVEVTYTKEGEKFQVSELKATRKD